MARITINGVSIDPLAQGRQLDAVGLPSPDAANSDHLLVQTSGPLSEAERAQLEATGAAIDEYVPDDTYLCTYKPTDLSSIRQLSFVTWADVYYRQFKIPPSLRPEPSPDVFAVAPMTSLTSPSRKLQQVDIVLHKDVNPRSTSLRKAIGDAAGLNPRRLETGQRKIRITVEQGRLGAIAALDQVHHIEPVPQRQLFNNVARGIISADVVVNGTPYEGDGEVIAVADTGLDNGDIATIHPAFTGRVARLYALGRTSPARADESAWPWDARGRFGIR